jgi:hypothetical protein
VGGLGRYDAFDGGDVGFLAEQRTAPALRGEGGAGEERANAESGVEDCGHSACLRLEFGFGVGDGEDPDGEGTGTSESRRAAR